MMNLKMEKYGKDLPKIIQIIIIQNIMVYLKMADFLVKQQNIMKKTV